MECRTVTAVKNARRTGLTFTTSRRRACPTRYGTKAALRFATGKDFMSIDFRLVLGGLAALVVSCSSKPDCGQCSGCCLGSVCKVGTTRAACGSASAECSVCNDNQQCIDGLCKQTCDDTTCAGGCCFEGQCLGSADTACGSGGGKCTQCPSGTACTNHRCETCSERCASGCCDGSNCVGGNQDVACGVGAVACSNCTTATTDSHCVQQQCTPYPTVTIKYDYHVSQSDCRLCVVTVTFHNQASLDYDLSSMYGCTTTRSGSQYSLDCTANCPCPGTSCASNNWTGSSSCSWTPPQ